MIKNKNVLDFYNKEDLLRQIKEAYASLKVGVICNEYANDENTACCPLTALYCGATKSPLKLALASYTRNFIGRVYNVDIFSVESFILGFDNRGKDGRLFKVDDVAYQVGQYVREALLPKQLTGET